MTSTRTFLGHLSKINKMINFYQLFQDGQKQTRSNCTFPPPFVSLKLTKLLRQHAAETLLHCSMTETPFTKFDAQRIEFNCPPKQAFGNDLFHGTRHPTESFGCLLQTSVIFLIGKNDVRSTSFYGTFWDSPKNHAPLFVFSLSPPTAVCTARSDPNSWQQNSFRGLPGTQAIPRSQQETLKFRGPCGDEIYASLEDAGYCHPRFVMGDFLR